MALIKGKQIQSLSVDKVIETAGKKFISETEKTKLSGIAENANNYVHPEKHAATVITEDSTHRFVTDAEKANWNDKYTKAEVDNKVSAAFTGLVWKNPVATFSTIATTYPTPQEGWTVSVEDTNLVYRYDSATTTWVETPLTGYVKATESLDGLMSKEDKAKLNNIEDGANNYVHPDNHSAAMIVEDEIHKFMTSTEKSKLEGLYNVELKTILVYPSVNGVTTVNTGIKTDGTGTYHTANMQDITLAINGFTQTPSLDYTVSENAQNELIINWIPRHFQLESDDELVISFLQSK